MDRAIQALSAAEAALKDIIAHALATKAYGELAQIATAAQGVSNVRLHLSGTHDPSPISRGTPPGIGTPTLAAESMARGVAQRRSAYPRFARQGDKLLKVAWSKKARQPYEHRAPQATVQILVEAIRKRKGEGKLFQPTDVLPLISPAGEEYPSYQSYVALAWLRQVGIVSKMGRKGYLLKRGAGTPDRLAEHWAALPAED